MNVPRWRADVVDLTSSSPETSFDNGGGREDLSTSSVEITSNSPRRPQPAKTGTTSSGTAKTGSVLDRFRLPEPAPRVQPRVVSTSDASPRGLTSSSSASNTSFATATSLSTPPGKEQGASRNGKDPSAAGSVGSLSPPSVSKLFTTSKPGAAHGNNNSSSMGRSTAPAFGKSGGGTVGSHYNAGVTGSYSSLPSFKRLPDVNGSGKPGSSKETYNPYESKSMSKPFLPSSHASGSGKSAGRAIAVPSMRSPPTWSSEVGEATPPPIKHMSLKERITMEMFGSPVNRKPPGGASVGIDLTGEDDVKLAPGESAWMAKEDAEKALADLVKDIYADMTEVDMAEATPDGLSCQLLPHQVPGVAWLRSREKGKKRGGILADDMGLGKTVQCIALMLANRPPAKASTKGQADKTSVKQPRGTLIVAPLALLKQWQEEINLKVQTGHKFKVALHHGAKRTKHVKDLEKYDVVITTYSTLVSEAALPKKSKDSKSTAAPSDSDSDSSVQKKIAGKKEKGPLFKTKWHRIILDEAHAIKNRSTGSAKACFLLEGQFRWCLSGTPVQNNIEDLFSFLCFLQIKPLHEWQEFKRKIADPMKKNQGVIAIKRVQAVLGSVMLRRKKDTIIDGKPILSLPARNIHVSSTDFVDPEERAFYDAVQAKAELQLNKFVKAGTVMSNYTSVLTAILRMRQACLHPHIIANSDEKSDAEGLKTAAPKAPEAKLEAVPDDDDDDLDALTSALGGLGLAKKRCCVCQVSFDEVKQAKGNLRFCVSCDGDIKMFEGLTFSTKIKQLMDTIKQIKSQDPKRKIIVFSQFVTFLNLLKPFMQKAGIKFVVYDGSMKIDKRDEALDKMRNDPAYTVILVSFKCGSVGLNLTACSVVCLMDLWWNPALENQAIDRAHRFGQTRAVDVYKFTIQDTVETRILELQEKKRALADAALDGGDVKSLGALNIQEIMHLFRGNGGGD